MSKLRSWLVTLALAILACPVAYFLGSLGAAHFSTSPTAALPTVNGLQIAPAELNLGEIWETPEHTATVHVVNTTGQPRTIRSFASSCDCLGVEPNGLTIPMGRTAAVTVRIDLTRRMPYERGLARRPVSVRLDPVFEGDYTSTRGWEVTALVRSRVTLDADALAFADLCTHGGPPVPRQVRATVHVPGHRVSAVAVPDVAAVKVEPSESGEFILTVSPNPTLPVGPFQFAVNVSAVAPDGATYKCPSVSVNGDMQPPVRVFPRVVLLGEHDVPGQAEADVTVRLPANGWAVERIETGDPGTTAARAGTDADGGIRYRIAQAVTLVGDHVAEVRFVVRDPAGRTESVKVEVHYHGQAIKR